MTVMNNSWPSGRGGGRRGWICIVLDALAFIKITRVLMFLLVEKSIRSFLNNRAVLPCAHKMAGRKEKSSLPLVESVERRHKSRNSPRAFN